MEAVRSFHSTGVVVESRRARHSLTAFGASACCLFGLGALLAGEPAASAAEGVNGITAVSARVSKDYVRAKLPDGSFQPESYAFGEGGNWGGEISDATIDPLSFLDVARIVAAPLEERRYIPARDPSKTKLLIMLYWGTTAVPPPYAEDALYQNFQNDVREYRTLLGEGQYEEAQAVYAAGLAQLSVSNQMRDRTDFKNAGMLGYNSDFSALVGTDYGDSISRTALGFEQKDQVSEIEETRYFVVLMAYDFHLMWKEKKHKLLWETRFSINERNNAFDKALPVMAQYASRYFGQPSDGILRMRVREGHVEIGEVKFLGEVSGSPK
jgi:hypothetical protein